LTGFWDHDQRFGGSVQLDKVVVATYSHSDLILRMTKQEFKRLRKSVHYSQAKLAEKLDLYIRTISRYETGELNIPKVAELALRYIVEKATKEGT
jgi:DNA-binding XRE family transcriptional regulator